MKEELDFLIDQKKNFSSLSFNLQTKYLAFFYTIITSKNYFTAKDISALFELSDLPSPRNIKDICNKISDKNEFIKTNEGYKLNRTLLEDMQNEFDLSKPRKKISKNLRQLIPKLKTQQNKNYLKEAIECYEIEAFRAAIIMTWLLTINNIYDFILKNKLNDFNNELKKHNLKIKSITIKEDFSDLKEVKFIEICRAAGIISKDVRKILDEKLGIRNTCAHPNNIKISESKASSFIEDLVYNVLQIFV